ncbi:MAG: Holliday junction resolvase RuvX [Bacteroidales bacterium]|nr:Holliday junction resolvase RuvX [Bacteroidales bacterium]
MGRILSIDYGRKRTGLAVTDPLQIIANGLTTISTKELEKWLMDYITREGVERVVVGMPRRMSGEMSESWQYIEPFLNRLHTLLPDLPIELVDERFTSKLASQTILMSGVGKQRRREDKGMIDEVSATIILQQWMDNRSMPGYTAVMFPLKD